MRFIFIAQPGQQYGPCEQCDHYECRRARQIALSPCHLCTQSIGFGRAYCFDADERPVHFVCLATEIKRQAQTLNLADEAVLPPPPLVYDRPTAAKLLAIGVSTLDALVAQDQISRCRVGSRITFLPQHLTDFLKRREQRCRAERGAKILAIK